MLAAQGYACKICETPFSHSRSRVVDHDHKCCPGRISCGACVRGLLCRMCNLLISYSGDDPDLCVMAANYLRKFQ